MPGAPEHLPPGDPGKRRDALCPSGGLWVGNNALAASEVIVSREGAGARCSHDCAGARRRRSTSRGVAGG